MIAGSVYPVYWHIHHCLMKGSGFRPSDEKVNLVPHGVEEMGAWVQQATFRACVREHGGSWEMDRAVGCSQPWILQESWAMCVSEHDVSDHVVSKNTTLCPPTPKHPSLHKHSAKAQWDSAADPPCVLLAVTPTCFCGFYRQLQTTVSRMATPTPLNTDPLCSHGGSWEEPSGTQHRDQLSVCVCMCTCVHVY